MGLLVPPRPLTKEEFGKAYKDGKRTLAELDPRLWRWAGWFARRKYRKNKGGVAYE